MARGQPQPARAVGGEDEWDRGLLDGERRLRDRRGVVRAGVVDGFAAQEHGQDLDLLREPVGAIGR